MAKSKQANNTPMFALLALFVSLIPACKSYHSVPHELLHVLAFAVSAEIVSLAQERH